MISKFINCHYLCSSDNHISDIFIFQNYWVSYIFKKVVGSSVLALKTTHKNLKIRLYAHCSKEADAGRNSVVIFGMNLSPSDYKGRIVIGKFDSSKIFRVEKYILTAISGQVTSRYILCLSKHPTTFKILLSLFSLIF